MRNLVNDDGHVLVKHEELIKRLRETALSSTKSDRARAIQAQRYARRRLECLVDWNFSIEGLERKDIITWSFDNIQKYFRKV